METRELRARLQAIESKLEDIRSQQTFDFSLERSKFIWMPKAHTPEERAHALDNRLGVPNWTLQEIIGPSLGSFTPTFVYKHRENT